MTSKTCSSGLTRLECAVTTVYLAEEFHIAEEEQEEDSRVGAGAK